MSIKLARIIRFDPTLSVTEKIERLEPMAEAFAEGGFCFAKASADRKAGWSKVQISCKW